MRRIARWPSVEELDTWLDTRVARVKRGDIILCSSVIIYTIVFSAITILMHNAFRTHAWDLGIFTQSFWTTLNANHFLFSNCELVINTTGIFFGVHFSPILFLILPLYWMISTPETLLVLQSLILGLAAVPIYKLAKENGGNQIGGLVFSFAYLLYPAIQFVNLYEFHVQVFLPLFFAFVLYYATKEKWIPYFLFALLALMVEEHAAQIMLFVGIYLMWTYRSLLVPAVKREKPIERKLLIPFVTIALSVIWYLFTVWQRNTFFPTNPAAMYEFLGSGNFKILGANNPLEVPLFIILRPWSAVQALAFDGTTKLLYIIFLFGPLAFFSFRAPSALIPTISWFVFSFTSQALCHHMLMYHYETYTVAFIFAAAVFASKKGYLGKSSLKNVSRNLKVIMISSAMFSIILSPLLPVGAVLFPGLLPDYRSIHVGEHEIMLNEVIAMMPANASILTQNNLFPHVSHRIDAYVVPDPWIHSTINDIVVDFVNKTIDKVDYVLIDIKTNSIATDLVLSLLKNKTQFVMIASRDNDTILLYKRAS